MTYDAILSQDAERDLRKIRTFLEDVQSSKDTGDWLRRGRRLLVDFHSIQVTSRLRPGDFSVTVLELIQEVLELWTKTLSLMPPLSASASQRSSGNSDALNSSINTELKKMLTYLTSAIGRGGIPSSDWLDIGRPLLTDFHSVQMTSRLRPADISADNFVLIGEVGDLWCRALSLTSPPDEPAGVHVRLDSTDSYAAFKKSLQLVDNLVMSTPAVVAENALDDESFLRPHVIQGVLPSTVSSKPDVLTSRQVQSQSLRSGKGVQDQTVVQTAKKEDLLNADTHRDLNKIKDFLQAARDDSSPSRSDWLRRGRRLLTDFHSTAMTSQLRPQDFSAENLRLITEVQELWAQMLPSMPAFFDVQEPPQPPPADVREETSTDSDYSSSSEASVPETAADDVQGLFLLLLVCLRSQTAACVFSLLLKLLLLFLLAAGVALVSQVTQMYREGWQIMGAPAWLSDLVFSF